VATPGFVMVFVSELSLHAAATGAMPLRLTVGGTSSGDVKGAAASHTFTEAGERFGVSVPVGSVHGAAAVLPWIILAAGLVLAALAGAYGINAARRARAQDEVDRLFTLSSDLITVAGFDGFWKRVNPAFETRLGYSEREALARPYLEFIHPDDRERSEAESLRLLGGETVAFENRVVCKDGSYRWVEWKATPVLEEGTLYGVGRDVTERRRAEIGLRRLADEQAALRRVATLVAQGVRPDELFSVVSEEVGHLLGTEAAAVVRFDHSEPAIVFVGVGAGIIEGLPVGTRWDLEQGLASAEVFRTGRSTRVNAVGRSSASGPVAAMARRLGVVSTVASPIVVEGRLWGAVTVSSQDEALPVDAEDRLEKFTELVATAVSNIEARRELNASRARVVAAADETRRRLERDLHDGIQQRLVALALRARTAEAAPQLPTEVQDELSQLSDGLRAAIDEVREVSRGIHPAILSESGLKPALKALARRLPLPVKLNLDLDQRLPEPLEVAGYYVVSEAFTNAVKHAQASAVELTAHRRDGLLMLTVRDDGIGGADASRGSGIIGLTDRVEALGGTISLVSPPGAGTMLQVQLPTDLAATTDTSTVEGAQQSAELAES
jgi:PAS domain S-box-containing protein